MILAIVLQAPLAVFVIVGFATTFDNVKKRFFFGEMTSNQEVPILNQFDGDMQALEEGGVIIDGKEPRHGINLEISPYGPKGGRRKKNRLFTVRLTVRGWEVGQPRRP